MGESGWVGCVVAYSWLIGSERDTREHTHFSPFRFSAVSTFLHSVILGTFTVRIWHCTHRFDLPAAFFVFVFRFSNKSNSIPYHRFLSVCVHAAERMR